MGLRYTGWSFGIAALLAAVVLCVPRVRRSEHKILWRAVFPVLLFCHLLVTWRLFELTWEAGMTDPAPACANALGLVFGVWNCVGHLLFWVYERLFESGLPWDLEVHIPFAVGSFALTLGVTALTARFLGKRGPARREGFSFLKLFVVLLEIALLVFVYKAFQLNIVIGAIVLLFWVFLWWPVSWMIHEEVKSIVSRESPVPEPKKEPSPFVDLVGRTCSTVSVLNPAGLVEIDGKRIEATSLSNLIKAGSLVKIVAAKPKSVVVELENPTP